MVKGESMVVGISLILMAVAAAATAHGDFFIPPFVVLRQSPPRARHYDRLTAERRSYGAAAPEMATGQLSTDAPAVQLTATTTTSDNITSSSTTTEALPSNDPVSNDLFPARSGKNSFGSDSIFGRGMHRSPTKSAKLMEKGNFDRHLDGIITNLAKTIRQNGFDPISIGNLLQCSNCTLEGLSLIRRSGPSNFVYANRTVTVDAYLTLPALYISCFPCIDVILMVPLSGMLEIALWDLTIYGKVQQRVTRGASPTLVAYEVINEGDLDISFNARGLLAPITEFGFKVIRQRQVSDIIREFVYERVPKFIRRRLRSFTSPIGK